MGLLYSTILAFVRDFGNVLLDIWYQSKLPNNDSMGCWLLLLNNFPQVQLWKKCVVSINSIFNQLCQEDSFERLLFISFREDRYSNRVRAFQFYLRPSDTSILFF